MQAGTIRNDVIMSFSFACAKEKSPLNENLLKTFKRRLKSRNSPRYLGWAETAGYFNGVFFDSFNANFYKARSASNKQIAFGFSAGVFLSALFFWTSKRKGLTSA